MTTNENTESTGQQTPAQSQQQTTSPPPRPDTTAHQPNVTYITKSYKGDPNRPLIQRDAE